ncbi:MAG: hypothetical protein K1X82_12695 [Bacteroidia bacterium]|nr:hypothetical protein [Bacteroidia bacterium]
MSNASFQQYSKQDWMNRFTKELKDAHVDDLIKRNPAEELSLFPYFVEGESVNHDISGLLPDKTEGGWEQVFPVYPNTRNEQILEALNFGANCLYIEEVSPNLMQQLKGVQLAYIQTHFFVRDIEKLHELHLFLTQSNQLDFQGSVSISNPNLWEEANRLFPIHSTLEVNCLPYHLEGANVVLELAIALASGKEKNQGIRCLPRFRFGISTDYFLEIAKIRAFRLAWANLAGAIHCNNLVWIQSETSERESAQVDTDTNLLRLTTMTMSAISGTADSVVVHPHDSGALNGQRLALNIQNLLREEGNFASVNDPGYGAYYVEQLTDLVLKMTWEKFLWIEELGGMKSALDSGKIHQEMQRLNAIRNQALQEGKVVKIGVNKYLAKAKN